MRTTCSDIMNMGLKLEMKLRKQMEFILLCLYIMCAEYGFKTFGATRVEIRLMSFYLNQDVIDVSLET